VNTKTNTIYIVLIGVVIALVSIGGTYYFADIEVTRAANIIEMEIGTFEITNIKLLPPTIEGIVRIFFENPSQIDLTIVSFSAELYVKSGDLQYFLGNVTDTNRLIPKNGITSIPIEILARFGVVELILEEDYDVVLSGEMIVSGRSLFWTIINEQTIVIEK
jgi:hypothetical protein